MVAATPPEEMEEMAVLGSLQYQEDWGAITMEHLDLEAHQEVLARLVVAAVAEKAVTVRPVAVRVKAVLAVAGGTMQNDSGPQSPQRTPTTTVGRRRKPPPTCTRAFHSSSIGRGLEPCSAGAVDGPNHALATARAALGAAAGQPHPR